METEARIAGFHPRTENRFRNANTIRPITPQGGRALRVGDAQRSHRAASSASTNPAETRANPQAAQICRRGSTELVRGKTIHASATQSRQHRGGNRGITAHAPLPPQAAARAKMSAVGLARRPGAYRRCFRGPAEGKKQPRNPSPNDRQHRHSPVAHQGIRSILQVRSSRKAQARANKQSSPQPQH